MPGASYLLRGHELANLPVVENAYLIIEDDIIAEYGEMKNYKYNSDKHINVKGRLCCYAMLV